MKYKCIIFDCDGVLVDSETISNKTLVDMAKTVGVTLDYDFVMTHFLGKSLQYCFDYIEHLAPQKLPDTFETEFRERTFEAFRTQMQPIPGVHELLSKIKIDVAVASNGPAEKIRLNLTTTNLIDRFEGNIFSAYDINSWKPNPELYLHAAKSMGYDVKDCVVIEDSLAGVQAALAGGFSVFGYRNPHNKDLFKEINIPLFDDMSILDRLLV
ncbi:HAD family phosphatase [Flavobacterium sp. UMI-01]|uniref:HAD family hydrolase n=1 Tax=Flavobacterium sp. UMI-01 TaxID=1441053 RepID=UPI001C7D4DE9|nr:HAD family hydrolase [Flavobacterium sp. UMI-01]GIZ09424.1 sugar transferase [Flavobacterium sp. UMI-01]